MSAFEADAEERAMEAEALEAIFMEDFADESSGAEGSCYVLTLKPEDAEEAFVSCVLKAECPVDYPSASRPVLSIASVSGLSSHRRKELEAFLGETAEEQEFGGVVVFEVASAVREWLAERNEPGQADESMYAAMLRRDEDAKKGTQKKKVVYESSSAPESDEARKRRLEEEAEARRLERLRLGTAVTPETFAKWWEAFRVNVLKEDPDRDFGGIAAVYDANGKRKLTGKELFLKGAAKEAAEPPADATDPDLTGGALNEELFEEDDDLDDLDFEDDDDDDDDDDA